MDKVKCIKCSLVNLSSDHDCRRCGNDLGTRFLTSSQRIGPREAAKSSSWLWTLLFIALIGGGAYYIFSGVEKSFDSVKANDEKRVASAPTDGLSTRSEYEQRQKQNYKTGISNSQGLSESQKHNEDVQKAMQAAQK